MTDRSKKITELVATSSAIANDVMVVVTNTATTAVTKKINVGNLFANITATAAFSNAVSFAANVSMSGALSVGGNTVINANGAWAGSSTGLKGDKGDVGSKGDLGPIGDKGQKGEYGINGDKGQKGETSPVPGPYADDAAAAAGNVAIGEMYYQSSGAVYVRLT